MDKECKISIIIPVYNAELYLEKCLNSLKEQTFSAFEVLCINDGSTDQSKKIIDSFAERDARFKLIEQENQGASAARNAGLKLAQGEYIMFLDSDDWYEPETCEKAYEAITSENADVALFSAIWEYTNNSVVNHALEDKYMVLEGEECIDLRRKMFGLVGKELGEITKFDYLSLLYLKIYRRKIIEKNGLQVPDIKKTGSFEDGLFNIYYFKHVEKAVYTGLPLYHYRKDNDMSITSRYNPKLVEQWKYLFATMKEIVLQENLSEKYKEALNNRIAFSIVGIGSNCINAPMKKTLKQKQIKEWLRGEEYKKAIKSFAISKVPLIWKPLFLFSKWRWTFAVYCLLALIRKIRKNRNN